MNATRKLEPSFVHKIAAFVVSVSFFIQATTTAGVATPRDDFGSAPIDQEFQESLLPLLIIFIVDGRIPLWVSVECSCELLLKGSSRFSDSQRQGSLNH